MSPEIPDTPIGLAFAVFFVLAQLGDRLLRGWFWRLHQADRAAHIEALAKAPENVRTVIEAHEPEPPPNFGPLAMLLAAGALAGFVAGAARGELRLARLLVMPANAEAATLALRCSADKDCASGTCDRGQCVYPKESKPQTDRRRPRVVADVQGGTLCADCPNAPWMLSAIAAPQ